MWQKGGANKNWEMQQQQQLIERKRREIEAKRRAAAQAATAGAKLGGGSGGATSLTSGGSTAQQPVGSLSAASSAQKLFQAHKKSFRGTGSDNSLLGPVPETPKSNSLLRSVPEMTKCNSLLGPVPDANKSNVFDNDGSFLQMFQKMQQQHAATMKPKPSDLPDGASSSSGAPRMPSAAAGSGWASATCAAAQDGLLGAAPTAGADDDEKGRKRSRWGNADNKVDLPEPDLFDCALGLGLGSESAPPPAQVVRPPALLAYARRVFGGTDLTDAQWKQCADQMKMNVLLEDLKKKKQEAERLAAKGKHKYEYDSDEDTEGGTWEHKRRKKEMNKTLEKAEELTKMNAGKHHIGDFLPPDELERFMENWRALKEDREPDFSDYKEFKLKEDNMGFQMLKKMGWTEGAGLGSDGAGITAPITQKQTLDSAGVGTSKPGNLQKEDDEFDAYRKRMMLAYKFRPNPLNNPRRTYY